jgi:hypothetical protein
MMVSGLSSSDAPHLLGNWLSVFCALLRQLPNHYFRHVPERQSLYHALCALLDCPNGTLHLMNVVIGISDVQINRQNISCDAFEFLVCFQSVDREALCFVQMYGGLCFR